MAEALISLLTLEPAFYAVAIFAVIITGISKSGLGGGLGQLSVPLMAAFISPITAVTIMMPILVVIDLINIWGYRRNWHRGNLVVLLPGAVVGIGIGALTYKYVDENLIRILLGVIVMFFALTYFTQKTATDGGLGGGLGGAVSSVSCAAVFPDSLVSWRMQVADQ